MGVVDRERRLRLDDGDAPVTRVEEGAEVAGSEHRRQPVTRTQPPHLDGVVAVRQQIAVRVRTVGLAARVVADRDERRIAGELVVRVALGAVADAESVCFPACRPVDVVAVDVVAARPVPPDLGPARQREILEYGVARAAVLDTGDRPGRGCPDRGVVAAARRVDMGGDEAPFGRDGLDLAAHRERAGGRAGSSCRAERERAGVAIATTASADARIVNRRASVCSRRAGRR